MLVHFKLLIFINKIVNRICKTDLYVRRIRAECWMGAAQSRKKTTPPE